MPEAPHTIPAVGELRAIALSPITIREAFNPRSHRDPKAFAQLRIQRPRQRRAPPSTSHHASASTSRPAASEEELAARRKTERKANHQETRRAAACNAELGRGAQPRDAGETGALVRRGSPAVQELSSCRHLVCRRQ